MEIRETSAVITVINFIIWAAGKSPSWTLYLWITGGIIFIIDYMLGGVTDRGIAG